VNCDCRARGRQKISKKDLEAFEANKAAVEAMLRAKKEKRLVTVPRTSPRISINSRDRRI